MILGAVCAALACLAGLHAIVPGPRLVLRGSELIRVSTYSPIEWRLHQQARQNWYQRWLRPSILLWARRLRLRPVRLEPALLLQAGLDPEKVDLVELRALRLMMALLCAALGGVAGLLFLGSLATAPLLAWLGYIAPVRVLVGRRRRRQAAILADLPELISMVRAFMAAGMSLERALHVLAADGHGAGPLTAELRRALGRYGLGLSIEEALQEIGPRTGVDDLQGFATALAQTKRAGSGMDTTLRDQELVVRMNRRNRATAEAAAVGTKLLAVLAGIYLPEFVILIVIPLFWGIMQRAFG